MSLAPEYVDFLFSIFGLVGLDSNTTIELTATDTQAHVTVYRESGTISSMPPSTTQNFVMTWRRTKAQCGMMCKDHTYLISVLATLTNGVTYRNDGSASGSQNGQVCGADTVCPPGYTFDPKTRTCVQTTTQPPPTQPPPGGTQPPSNPFPSFTGNPLNPNDWIQWLGQVIAWAVKQIWIELTGVISLITTLLWSLLPAWMKQLIRNWSIIWGNLAAWTKDPQQTAFDIVDKLFEEK